MMTYTYVASLRSARAKDHIDCSLEAGNLIKIRILAEAVCCSPESVDRDLRPRFASRGGRFSSTFSSDTGTRSVVPFGAMA